MNVKKAEKSEFLKKSQNFLVKEGRERKREKKRSSVLGKSSEENSSLKTINRVLKRGQILS